MSVLEVRDLTVEVGGLSVLEGLSFDLRPGDKVGVVGRNGAGKTSLLRVLAGEADPVAGTVRRRGAIGYLRQDPRQHRAQDEASGLHHILGARGLVELAERMERLRLRLEEHASERDVARFSRIEERYRAAGGYAAEADVRRIAAGLGLADGRLNLPARALSGGERRRLELARILFAGSDLLLLDEPTNHLDADARGWLMKFLAAYGGALIVVSHDLGLLDGSITRILHLDRDRAVEYRGTYSQYRESRRQDEQRRTVLAERQQAEIRRLKTLADSMPGQTEKRARKAKTLDTRVARLRREAVAAPTHDEEGGLPVPGTAARREDRAGGGRALEGYGGPPVFEGVTFDVGRGERLLVIGVNGAGKTSLLRILAGQSEPDDGWFRLGHGVSIGYYAQEREGVHDGVPALAHVRAESGAAGDQELRALLGMFGLTGAVAFQDAGTLSGGEKTKLVLAQLVAGRRNLLLLDEPTNNLDPPSRTAIARALSSWEGAMVLVSHDIEFVQALAPQRVLMMPDGTLDFWSDDLLELVALA